VDNFGKGNGYLKGRDFTRFNKCSMLKMLEYMATKKTQEQILNEYEEKSRAILRQMMQIVLRAQRKIDDAPYAKTLKKLDLK